jgi:hypothetical protein
LQAGKAEAMNNNDDNDDDGSDHGLDDLLDLLKANPALMKEIVFNYEVILDVLESKAARRLVLGADATNIVDAQTFLNYVAGGDDGYPIAQCLKGTKHLCAKGTKYSVQCAGGTKPVPPIGKHPARKHR